MNDLFADRVTEFLAVNSHPFLGSFSDSLAKQLNRLSTVEKQILSILATMKNPVALRDLKAQFQSNEIIQLMQTLDSLERRSLISITQTLQDTFYQLNRLIGDYMNTAKSPSRNELVAAALK